MSTVIRARLVQTAAGIAAALLVAGAAAPLQARVTPGGSASANAATRQAAPAQAERRICARVALPNSRITQRVCRTPAEWDRFGGLPASGD